MGMYDVFETDEDLETSGIWLDYGDFRVKIASAGQGNKKYVKYAEKALKPVRKAMQAGALSNERSMSIMSDIYAKTIVLDWETMKEGELVKGIESRDGQIMPFNYENVRQVFIDLPNLFIDIQEQANSIANFRKAELEEESGN
ncbi:MAG: hypothetical protein Unbinned200contig1000_18 [Prokaryotic dsDNA virus sp.]|jgi:hypothetical protein|nr:hypothetical protein [Flavobacteriaceae bacterium]QDP65278.1 MAG: hypothetical protein Unbinned200contig1000_18 [Prokaryotic dsDNA virus sp.]|tara:strand:+ start:25530 stop:25958 length:429 start_codon:yes stop_codon:yes gene_type:complete